MSQPIRCNRVEAWVYGFVLVKFDTEHDPSKKALLSYRHCPGEATVSVTHDGMEFHWCAHHAKDPTCGAIEPGTEIAT